MGWTVAYEAGEALKNIRDQGGWEHEHPMVSFTYETLWESP